MVEHSEEDWEETEFEGEKKRDMEEIRTKRERYRVSIMVCLIRIGCIMSYGKNPVI